jgi:hypothetical protein
MAETPKEVRWLELDRDRRRRIARAVRKGLAVTDPRDAPYAVGFADATLDWLSWKRRFRPLHLLLVVLVLAELMLTGGWHPAVILYSLLGFTFIRLRAPRLRERLRAAKEANTELAERLKLSPVAVQMPARALFQPRSRLRRRVVTSLVFVLVCLVALAVVATVWAIGQNRHWTAAANRVCAREQARLAALPVRRLGPIEGFERTTLIEEDALAELKRLNPRTPLQKNFVAWREYEVKLDVWVIGQLASGDQAGVTLGKNRISWARNYSRALARRLGAKTCARAQRGSAKPSN